MKRIIFLSLILIISTNYVWPMEEERPVSGTKHALSLLEASQQKITSEITKKENLIKFLKSSAYRGYILQLPVDLQEKIVESILKNNIPFKEKLLAIVMKSISRILTGHMNAVNSVSCSPNGQLLASGSWDNTIRIWDIKSGEIKHVFHSDHVKSVTWNPANKKYIASGSGKRINIWNVEDKKLENTLLGSLGIIFSVTWSPNGQLIASGGDEADIRVWDINTRKVKHILSEEHDSYISSVVWSPNGELIASGSGDGKICIWDSETGKLNIAWDIDKEIQSIAWHPKSGLIVTGDDSGEIDIWDILTGELKLSLTGHTDSISSIAWSPDGKFIISGSGDKTIRIWNSFTGELKYTLTGHKNAIESIALSWTAEEQFIVSGSAHKTIRIWDFGALERFFNTLSLNQVILLLASYEGIDKEILESYFENLEKEEKEKGGEKRVELTRQIINTFY